MELEELTALKERLADAERCKAKLDQIKKAMGDIDDGTAEAIQLELLMTSPQTPTVLYRKSGYKDFTGVCWVRDYPELTKRLKDAVLAVLHEYENEAIDKLNAV